MSAIPNIRDVVDVEKWRWVVPHSQIVETYLGPLALPRGFLSDGATGPGVRDLEPLAFCGHDRMYVSPMIGTERINKIQADLVYAQILMRNWRLIEGVIRPAVLITWPGSWAVWREYRRKEAADPNWWHQSRFVPHALMWDFPNWQTRFAVWSGDSGTIA
jgi:hypothetical protein